MDFNIEIVMFAGLILTSAIFPAVGGLGLLLGYVLADKSFALLNTVNSLHIPLFITEPVLGILLLRAVFVYRQDGRWAVIKQWWKSPWFWFYSIGLWNVIVGLSYYPAILVLRDSAIVFYGIITQITLAFVKKPSHLKVLFFTVLGGLFLRYVLQYFFDVFGFNSNPRLMYTACVILASFAVYPRWGKFKWLMLLVNFFLLASIVSVDIRSVWVALIFAYVCMFIGLLLLRLDLDRFWKLCGVTLASIVMTVSYLHSFKPDRYEVRRERFAQSYDARRDVGGRDPGGYAMDVQAV
jgi:hypothetical protein